MKRHAPTPSLAVWICVGLGLLTFLLFAPCLRHEFLDYDDQQYVTENPHVLAGLSWPGVVWAFKSLYANNWQPLTWLSHMLDCQLYGLHPAGHHLTNVLLHATNSVLLFLLLRAMTAALWRSAAVAALFAWHPLHVESVAWLAERKDVLSALFFLLTLLAYREYVRSKNYQAEEGRGERGELSRITHHVSRIIPYALTLLFFALGLMSKPMLVSVPFVLLLLDLWPLQRFRWPKIPIRLLVEKIPFLILSAGCAVVTILAQSQSHALVSSAALPFGARLAHALLAYVHYLAAMFVPRHLAICYPYQATAGSSSLVALAAVLLLLITGLAFSQAARRPYFLVGWLWYVVMLVPVVGLVQVGDQAWADRYTYLPLIGPFVALVWGAAELLALMQSAKSIPNPEESERRGAQASACSKQGSYPRSNSTSGGNQQFLQAKASAISITFEGAVAQTAIAAIALCVGAAMVAATSLQIRYWRNTRALFEHALHVTPRNTRALAVLGSLLAKEGKIQQAKELYRQALSYRPDDPEAHFFMGVALAHESRFDEALAEYSQALWFKPLEAKTHLFMGVALAKQQKYDEAAAQYQAALALEPDSAVAHNDLARVLHSQGRSNEAMEHYAAALKLDPNLAEAHNNLGVLLLQAGQTNEGAVQLREAVRLNPADTESQYNLALALNQQQKWSEAAEILSRLEPTRSQDPNLQNQFALTLARLGKTRDAMSHYAKALLLRQDFPEALEGLAWLLSTDPHPEFRNAEQAVAMAERACELTGRKEPSALMTLAAAYAEAGRYTDAATAAQEALALAEAAGRNEVAIKCRAIASAAKTGKAWREGAKESR